MLVLSLSRFIPVWIRVRYFASAAVNHSESPLSDVERQRWLDELQRFNDPLQRRHPVVADLAACMTSFHEAHLMQSAEPKAFDIAREVADPRRRTSKVSIRNRRVARA